MSGSTVDPRIMAAVMRLPARQRQVVALRLILDLDTGRTAEVLGIAPGTVMAHLSDGRAYLVIHPSALPSSVGVSIFDEPGARKPPAPPRTQGPGNLPPAGITGPLAIGLVHQSRACTGS